MSGLRNAQYTSLPTDDLSIDQSVTPGETSAHGGESKNSRQGGTTSAGPTTRAASGLKGAVAADGATTKTTGSATSAPPRAKVRDESAVWKGLKRFLKDRNALIALATYLVLLLVVCIAIWVITLPDGEGETYGQTPGSSTSVYEGDGGDEGVDDDDDDDDDGY